MRKQILLIVFFILAIPAFADCQEDASNFESHPIKITIVGSNKYQDVDYVVTNLKRSNYVNELVVSTSGRNLVGLSGTYTGSSEAVIDEVESLSQNRFEVEVIKSKRWRSPDTLSITLKKLPPPTAK